MMSKATQSWGAGPWRDVAAQGVAPQPCAEVVRLFVCVLWHSVLVGV